LHDLDTPVTVRMAYEIGGQFSGKTNLEGSLTDSRVWGRFLAYNLDFDRKTAFVFYAPFETKHRYVVHLPPNYKLDGLPDDKTVRSKWGSFTVRVKQGGASPDGRLVDFEFHLRLEKWRVEPEDFDAFRDFHDSVSESYRVWLTLKPALDLDDAPLLEAVRHFLPDDAQTAATLAKLYLRHHRDESARRALGGALAYNRDDGNLWELMVKAAADLDGEEAAQRELVRLYPEDPRHGLALGTILVQNNKQVEARAALDPLTGKGPPATRAIAHEQLARSWYEDKKYDEALKHLKDAAKEDADSANGFRVHSLKGQIEEAVGHNREALVAYKQALAVEPDSPEALRALTRLSLRLNDRPAAVDYLRRYTVAVGEDVAGLLRAADSYLELREYDAAFELASRVREKTFHEKSQRILGLVYLYRGEVAEAIKHLEKADADAVVVEALLRCQLALGKPRELQPLLDKAAALDKPTEALSATADRARRVVHRREELARELKGPAGKEDVFKTALDAYVCAEQALAEDKSPRLVEALLTIAFAADVDLGPAYGLRGRLLIGQGKLTRALADAEHALTLGERDANGFYVRGRVRLERRQDGALADLEKAAELTNRKDAEVLHYLADAQFQAGRREEAVKTQREAVQLRPSDKEMAEQLAAFEKAEDKKTTNDQ
jgi:tetratricopeptide (TPR) repeat protein